MVREVITIKDFKRISNENEYFIWHFVQRNQEKNDVVFHSIYSEPIENKKNLIVDVLEKVEIPYFESYCDESIDFLINLGIDARLLWRPMVFENSYHPKEFYFQPIILGFHKSSFITSTFETCYCMEGLIDLIGELNPELLINSMIE